MTTTSTPAKRYIVEAHARGVGTDMEAFPVGTGATPHAALDAAIAAARSIGMDVPEPDAIGNGLSAATLQRLNALRMTWDLTYYPSLAPDPEIGGWRPANHYRVSAIVSYEDTEEAWGASPEAAARNMLSKLEE